MSAVSIFNDKKNYSRKKEKIKEYSSSKINVQLKLTIIIRMKEIK